MQLTRVKQEVESEYSTLKKTVQSKEQEEKKRQSMLEVSREKYFHHSERVKIFCLMCVCGDLCSEEPIWRDQV